MDDYTKKSPAIEVDTSIPGAREVRVLNRRAEIGVLPEVITVDNLNLPAGRLAVG